MFQPLPRPGDTLAGKYVVERQLGQGGMGAVFEVSHRVTGKRLALKCLLPDFTERTDIVERFAREAKAAGRIQHRHVVDVFDVGQDGALHFLVMELLEGRSFADLVHDSSLALDHALLILVRAMEGVAAAHAQGIVHRDLKPENIFVCVGPSGRFDDPRVLDFGISKIDDGSGNRLTKSGAAMGTPLYMSYEQLQGRSDLDQRVDVYAMGVILYEAMTGEPPHTAESVTALAIRVLTLEPVPLAQLRPDLPPGLSDVVMCALARDREQRYATMRAFIEALSPFAARWDEGAGARGGIPLRVACEPTRAPLSADEGAAIRRSESATSRGFPLLVGALWVLVLSGMAYGVWRRLAPAAGAGVTPAAQVQQPAPAASALGERPSNQADTVTVTEPTPVPNSAGATPAAAGAGPARSGAGPRKDRVSAAPNRVRKKAKRTAASSEVAPSADSSPESPDEGEEAKVGGRAGELSPSEFFGAP